MKRAIALVLSTVMIFSITAVAMADDTDLTATVPAAQYTLNIPADQEIEFGATDTVIGNVTVTDSKYFAENKNLEVTVTYDDFKAEGEERTLPFVLLSNTVGTSPYIYNNKYNSGSKMVFKGQKDTSVQTKTRVKNLENKEVGDQDTLRIVINSTDWARLYPTDYSTTITFSAEVVYPD